MNEDRQYAFWEALLSGAEKANGDGDSTEAETLFRRAIEVAEQNFGSRHINLAHSLLHFGDFLEQQERYLEGESAYRNAALLYQQNQADDLQAMALRNMAQCLWWQGRKREASEARSKARQLFRKNR